MSTRALAGCRYVAAPSVAVRVARVAARHVWIELIVRGQVSGHMTKLHRDVFEELFLREGGTAHQLVESTGVARPSTPPVSLHT